MALKGDREVFQDTIKYSCESATERGVVLMVKTAGSGVVIGDRSGKADLYLDPSGLKVAGLLMGDVITIDETRFARNQHKDEQKVGEKVRLARHAVLTTNMLKSGDAPTDGDTAYVTTSGVLTKTMSATGGIVATPKLGEFKGKKDEAGFVAVEVHLPIL